MTKQPWMKWYPSDWRGDPLVRACEPITRYVWIEMLGLMHEAEPHGHLVLGGRALDYKTLARVIAVDAGVVKGAVKELKERGVFSLTDEGVIYSRRMVRAENRSKTAQENGRKGGNPAVKKQQLSDGWDKRLDKPPDKPQKPEARSQSPPPPPESSASPSAAVDDLRRIADACIAAAGASLRSTGAAAMGAVADVRGWLAQGCDLEADVLPAIRAAALKAKPQSVGSFVYFRDAVIEARDRRAAIGAPPKPAEKPSGVNGDEADDATWIARIAYRERTGLWFHNAWGVEPQHAGTRCPEHLRPKVGENA